MTSINAIEKRTFKLSYDVIIIGAGLGGLSAALQLAIKGADVLLLEQHNLPGGFATSFVRGNYEFEATLHELCDFGPENYKGDVRKFLEEQAKIDCKFVRVPEAYHLILTKEKVDVIIPFGVDNMIQIIEKEFPGVKEELKKYMNLCYECTEAVTYIRKTRGKFDTNIIFSKYPNFSKFIHCTVDEVMKKFSLPDKVIQILYAYWSYQGVPSSRLNFVMWAIMLDKYFRYGAYIPVGTSHTLVSSMEKRIRELGGQIEYNTKVKKIYIKHGVVTAIETKGGYIISTNHVISNASPTLVYGKMLTPQDKIPEQALKTINARNISVSSFTVYLGLNAKPKDIGITSYEYFIAPHMRTDELYAGCSTLNAPLIQSAICLDNATPEITGRNRCQLSLTALLFGDTYQDVTPKNYYYVKTKMANQLIDQFSQATNINIRDYIEEIEFATPQTWARYTGAFKGHVFGYEQDIWDSVLVRTAVGEQEKYIKGLDFVGGGSTSGHGYTSSVHSGRAAALYALKEMGERQ